MVNDPWAAAGSRAAGDDPLDATAAPTTRDPWATQEQPTVLAAAPAAPEGLAALAQELAAPLVAPLPPVAPAPVPPMPSFADPAAYELPPAVERTAVPMPDLETTATSDGTVAAGRYGPYEFVIRLADGEGHPIDRPIVFGRRPDPGHGPGDARLVTIDDPQRTVSRSHLLALPAADGILLRNLSAVNALVLVSPEGDEAEVEPGGSITVTGPCRVVLGAYPAAVERA